VVSEPVESPFSARRGALRAAVIDAGFDQLSTVGLSDFSVAKIARQLGVSTAAPYRHFPGRDGVVAAVATVAARELAAEMDRAAQAAGPDPVEQLAATAGAYVRYVVRRGAGLNVIFAPGLEHLQDEDLLEAGRELMSLLLHLAENTGRPTADALVLVEQLTALAHGYALLFRDSFYARRHTAADDISGVATDAARTLIGTSHRTAGE
jgi:AcrR family transcriptional regulator